MEEVFVASFTDAWIETEHGQTVLFPSTVASFTDAWIETTIMPQQIYNAVVASFTDAWIETWKYGKKENMYASHLLQMRGLKLADNPESVCFTGRIFYRCVD